MILKDYLKWVSSHVPADSEKPTDIVQSLACLIGSRLSGSGKLPVSCGVGDRLDMDIVQAGILAGLEKIATYDGTLGSMRQYLYPTIAGAMQGYAWERENRVADSRPVEWPECVNLSEGETWPPQGADNAEYSDQSGHEVEAGLVTSATPQSLIEDEEASQTALAGIRAAVAGLGTEDMGLLLKDAQIGYNAAERLAWAREKGITLGALSMRLSRLRKTAREWALTVQ